MYVSSTLGVLEGLLVVFTGRETLWMSMEGYGIPPKLVEMAKARWQPMCSSWWCGSVLLAGSMWSPPGVKQGLQHAGILVLARLDHKKNSSWLGFCWQYCTDLLIKHKSSNPESVEPLYPVADPDLEPAGGLIYLPCWPFSLLSFLLFYPK